ncbi:unnamed protein product [Chilo suppressalis]|uniref:Uncharacterized protein n=1 Tax=Chilo suppressalis TaxID=168631 RepID=A0ABN8AZ14_CHISP|nr:unnamed protein product [Chilo suppressalis]
MVGPLTILKILHCKQLLKRRARKRSSKIKEVYDSSSDAEDQNETKEEEENICRVCMNEGNIPIFGNDLVEDVSESLRSFGGIEVEAEDAYSKHLCSSCYTQLQNAIAFRKTAQKTEQLLRSPGEESTDPIEPSFEDDTNGSVEMDDDEPYEYKNKKVKKERKWRCRRCDLDFKGFEDYQAHRLSDEHENFRQTCPICNKSFMHSSFRNHMKLHGQEKPYMCDFCGKKFRMQGQFSRHRATHIDDLPFQCSLCPYRGRFNECLKMHMRTHTGEKPYQCAECPARFVNKGNLTRHVLIHKEERDFKCDACDRGFYTKRELELHLKVDHTGVKDHVCNLCGKAFGYRRQMLKHQLKVHKREKLRGGRVPVYLTLESEKRRRELAENQML